MLGIQGLQHRRRFQKLGLGGPWRCSDSALVLYTWVFPKIRGTYYNGESNGKENGK